MEEPIYNRDNSLPVLRMTPLKFLLYSWSQLSGLGKALVYVFIAFTLLQISFPVIVLAQSSYEQCEMPFRMYITVYTLRASLAYPVFIPYLIEAAEKRSRHVRLYPNTHRFVALAENMRPWMELFTLIWFIFGNYLVFGSSNCIHTAPRLYFGTLSFIMVDYFLIAGFISIYISAVVCLPYVLDVLQNMGFANVSKRIDQERRKEAIDYIPVYQYRQTLELSRSNNRKDGLKNLPKLSDDVEAEGYGTIELEENAICCICLLCYQENDFLCKLWCSHHFHQLCIIPWLLINPNCPLCKQDFRSKFPKTIYPHDIGNWVSSSN